MQSVVKTPELPRELQDLIFDFTASTCDQHSFGELRLVSHHVKEHIEPLRFRCLIIANDTWDHFNELVFTQPESVLSTVHHIWIEDYVDTIYLSKSPAVTSLSFVILSRSMFQYLNDYSNLRYLNLTDITAIVLFTQLQQPHMSQPSSSRPLLTLPRSLTHLRIHAPYYAMGWVYNMQQAISHLSHITHLMVSYYPQGFEFRVWQVLLSIISDDLSPIERLVILKHPLNFTDGEWSPASAEPSDNEMGESSKIVWLEAGVGWTMKDDWKRRCRGDMDTWDQAEVIAEKRG